METLTLLATLLMAQDGWKPEHRDIAIPMRDGKTLAADVYLPPKPGKYPTVLIQTPYNKNFLRPTIGSGQSRGSEVGRGAESDILVFVDREHYAYAVVDWRGFYGSRAAKVGKGQSKLGHDGHDSVEWIATQTWSDGKVGTWGGSALGKVQFETAAEHPPHLVCCVPLIASMGQTYEMYYPGGVLLEAHVKTLDFLGFGVGAIVRAAPHEDAPAWKIAERATYRPDKIEVPCLMITGWWDHFPDLVIGMFEDVVAKGGEKARAHSRLMIGPWDHVGIGVAKQGDRTFDGAAKASGEAAKLFLDRWLRGIDNGWDRVARVRFWRTNEEGWTGADSWSGLKRARTVVPLKGERWSYVYDPKDPTKTLGGANLPPLPHGPTDQGALEARKDVLVWTTGRLERPLRVAGNVELAFDATVDRVSCDFTARLCDVGEDGKPCLVADAVQRLRDVKPGGKTRVALKFQATAVSARELRLYVSSSNSPRYERNPHTGADHWDEASALTLSVTIEPDSVEVAVPVVD